jgi:hypothetical protein
VKNLDWERVGPRGPSRESGPCLLARRAQRGDLAAKEDVSKKKSERETRKHTRKPASTRAGGRGIDWVGRTYPDPYLGPVLGIWYPCQSLALGVLMI